MVNACLDRLRAAKVRRADPLPDDLDERAGGPAAAVASATPVDAPTRPTVAADRRRAVLAALATLPPEQRAALVLVDMEGYPVEEAAEILDCAARHGEEPLLARPGPAAAAADLARGRRHRAPPGPAGHGTRPAAARRRRSSTAPRAPPTPPGTPPRPA